MTTIEKLPKDVINLLLETCDPNDYFNLINTRSHLFFPPPSKSQYKQKCKQLEIEKRFSMKPTVSILGTVYNEIDWDDEGESNEMNLEGDVISCSVCNTQKDERNEFNAMFDKNNPFISVIDCNCCYAPICPKCIEFDLNTEEQQEIKGHYLFIKSLIYLQCEEDEDYPFAEKGERLNKEPGNQYRWAIDVPLKKQFDEYSQVDINYNNYGINLDEDSDDDGIDRTDVIAYCVCPNCNFECSASIYMDS